MEAEHLKVADQNNVGLLSLTQISAEFQTNGTETDGVNPVAGEGNIMGFRVGGLGFLVDPGIYCEVIERSQVNPLPNMKRWFSGLLNLRGNIVPVIDLAILLGGAPAENKKRHLFAIDQGERTMALWIDSLPEIQQVRLQSPDRLAPLSPLLDPYISAACVDKDRIWLKVRFPEFFKALGNQGWQNVDGEPAQ